MAKDMIKASAPLEIDIQQAFRKRLYYVAPRVHVVAVPNAGKRTRWAAGQAKREGMSAGFPDVVCLWPARGVAFIEFKRPGGLISDNQLDWHMRLHDMGHDICLAYSADQAIDFLRSCGAPIMERAA